MLYPFIGAATNRAKSSQCSTTPFLRRVNLILSCTVATGVLGTVGLDVIFNSLHSCNFMTRSLRSLILLIFHLPSGLGILQSFKKRVRIRSEEQDAESVPAREASAREASDRQESFDDPRKAVQTDKNLGIILDIRMSPPTQILVLWSKISSDPSWTVQLGRVEIGHADKQTGTIAAAQYCHDALY